MTHRVVTQRERRTVVAGIAIIAGIVGFGRGLPAWRSWMSEARASAQELRAELVRARSDVAGLKASSDSLAVRSSRLDSASRTYLDGASPNAAAASLASTVSRLAETAGVRVASVGARVDSSKLASARAIASVTAVGDVRGLTRLLAGIERGPLLLSVASLSVSQGEVAAADDRAEALRIEMSVEGLVAPPRKGAHR